VRGTVLATILANNPGWVEISTITSTMAACMIGVAGDGTASGFSVRAADAGYPIGEERHTQVIAELAAHQHIVPAGQGSATADAAHGPGGFLSAFSNSGPTDPTGNSTPFNVMQPSWFLYCLQKS
jgi:hypothetical protein